jgi:hypothetical protein
MAYENIKPLGEDWVNTTISEGTLRTEDLAKAFLKVIGEHDPKIKDAILDEWTDVLFAMIDPKATRDEEQEMYLVEHLCNVMDAIAPEGCIFGALEHDGACFGFWAMEEVWER